MAATASKNVIHRYFDELGEPVGGAVWDVEFIMDAATGTITTPHAVAGHIEYVEIVPSPLTVNATLKGYMYESEMTTPLYWLNFTQITTTTTQKSFAPSHLPVNSANGALTGAVGQRFYVNGFLTVAVASAASLDHVHLRVYISED